MWLSWILRSRKTVFTVESLVCGPSSFHGTDGVVAVRTSRRKAERYLSQFEDGDTQYCINEYCLEGGQNDTD